MTWIFFTLLFSLVWNRYGAGGVYQWVKQISLFIAIVVAGLVGILLMRSWRTPSRHVGELRVYMPVPCSYEQAEDVIILIRILPGRRFFIRDMEFNETDLKTTIAKIMETRSRKILWIAGDERISYGELVHVLDELKSDIPDLFYVLVTATEIKRETTKVWHPRMKMTPVPLYCIPSQAFDTPNS